MIYAYLKHLFQKVTTIETRRKIVLFFVNLKRVYFKARGKKIVHVLHIGKTGGSAVKHAFGNNLITKGYAVMLHSHTIRLKDVPKGEKVVFFVRDPESRFVSSFNSTKRKGRPAHFVPWTKEEKIAFNLFKTPNELAESLSSKNKGLKKLAVAAMKNIEHVKTSYWDWFESKKYLEKRINDVFFVGRQETLNSSFSLLKKKLGLVDKVTLPSARKTMNKSPNNNTLLSSKAKKNLKKWYQKDYQFIFFLSKRGLINLNDKKPA